MANWYYVKDGKQKGPITEELLNSMMQKGEISPSTMVWKEGMSDWKEFRHIQFTPQQPSPKPRVDDMETCIECKNPFPRNEMMQYENSWICAKCKPEFVQRLKEGADIVGSFIYAGFWIRFVAKFIDGIILGVASFIIGQIITFIPSLIGSTGLTVLFSVISIGFQFAIGITYQAYFLSQKGATPGKMAMGLKVVTADGGGISVGRAIGRYFAEWLSGFILSIGYIMAAFDDEKRTLHDRICETRVIHVR